MTASMDQPQSRVAHTSAIAPRQSHFGWLRRALRRKGSSAAAATPHPAAANRQQLLQNLYALALTVVDEYGLD